MSDDIHEKEWLTKTDYLSETLITEKDTQIEIFKQMLYRLENAGKCRYVYHRLGRILYGDEIDEY